MSTRREEMRHDEWLCVRQRSHGICNTINSDEDESCGACGDDQPAAVAPPSAPPPENESLNFSLSHAREHVATFVRLRESPPETTAPTATLCEHGFPTWMCDDHRAASPVASSATPDPTVEEIDRAMDKLLRTRTEVVSPDDQENDGAGSTTMLPDGEPQQRNTNVAQLGNGSGATPAGGESGLPHHNISETDRAVLSLVRRAKEAAADAQQFDDAVLLRIIERWMQRASTTEPRDAMARSIASQIEGSNVEPR